jgi:glycosyltransferase involved in cell wall biosynthesis
VYEQEIDEEIELIIVDDGSTDDTLNVIRAISAPRLVLIKRSENGGAGAARTDGIKAARGEYLAFLDADDYWLPGFLSITKKFLDDHSHVLAVSVQQKHIITPTNFFFAPVFDIEKNFPDDGFVIDNFYQFWAKFQHVCTGSVLIRAAEAKRAGGMRADLRISQDLEYWMLLAADGKWGHIQKLLFVSDGLQVSVKRGWLTKNMIRWRSAPTVEEWQTRIIRNLDAIGLESFRYVQGIMARNLSYSMIQSKRDGLALRTLTSYNNYLPGDRMSRMMTLCAKNKLAWLLFCSLLRLREQMRDFMFRIF